MSRILIIWIIVIGLFSFPFIGMAQTITNPDSALQKILEQHEGKKISLEEAVQFAKKNATSVRIAEANYLAALGAVRRESGQFDPELYFNFGYTDQDAPTASFFAGAPILVTQQTNYQTGLRMNLPTGTELELSVNAGRLKSNSQFAFLNPEYNTFGSLTFRQPLLSGFLASGREQLSTAEWIMEAQKARYDQQALTVGSQVELYYWDLYAAERNYAVQQLIINQAKELLRETELRYKSGLVGPNQVANAKTFLAEQELFFINSEELLDIQSDRLALFIGLKPETGIVRYIPSDEPPKDYPVENSDLVVDMAIKNNLDLKAAQQDIESINVQAIAAKWKSLPQLNLVGSLGGNGLAGTPQDIIFGGDTLRASRSGSFSDALSQMTKREFPSWNIGLELNIPIGFRSGLGEKDRLKAEAYSSQQRYIELTRLLEEQVRTYWRELSHGKRRIDAASQGVNAAQEQVRIGLIEFQNGRSTAFELVRLGADLAAAQQRYSDALVRTAKAAALLKQLTSGKFSGTN